MPLVRIDMIEGRSDEELRTLLGTIQNCVVESFGVPETDRYQIVHEHKPGRMVFLDTGLGFTRSEQRISIQFFTSPRTHLEKIKLYKLLSEELEKECGLEKRSFDFRFHEPGRRLELRTRRSAICDWPASVKTALVLDGLWPRVYL